MGVIVSQWIRVIMASGAEIMMSGVGGMLLIIITVVVVIIIVGAVRWFNPR